jgi:hypothetical protein
MKFKLFSIVAVCICLLFVFSSLSMAWSFCPPHNPTSPANNLRNNSLEDGNTVYNEGTISCDVDKWAFVDFCQIDNKQAKIDGTNPYSLPLHDGNLNVSMLSKGGEFEFEVWSNTALTGTLSGGKLKSQANVELTTQYAEKSNPSAWHDAGINIIQSIPKTASCHKQQFLFQAISSNYENPGLYESIVRYTVSAAL